MSGGAAVSYSVEMYKRITGVEPPKPFAEKTVEERLRDRDRFLAIVNDSPDDDSPDDFLQMARMNPVFQYPDVRQEEQVDAA
jgi:hypothetical protein